MRYHRRGALNGAACAAALMLAGPLTAQRPAPAPPQSRSILVKGVTVHVGDGRTIDDGAVGFRNGTIDHVGFEYGVKAAYDTVIEARGAHVYPGLILANTTLGLQEVDQVRATADADETGELEPEVRTRVAFNVDSRIIPTVRANGVLLVQATPRGGLLSGTSSVMQLDAWDWQDATVRADDGVHLVWPAAFTRRGWWAEPGATVAEGEAGRERAIDGLREMFRAARAWRPANGVEDLRLSALKGLFDGQRTLYVHADRTREIQEAVLFMREMGVRRMVIVGGHDAWRVSDLLRDNKVDVVLERVHRLPLRDDEDIDLPYRLPALLKERGVRFCLGYAGDMERMGARNLPFTTGTAAAHGLDREAALQAVTLDAARILGIDARYGSLEPGKSATLVVSTGDLLDMRGNNVTHAFIDGRAIELDDHQKALYRQYARRYGH
jgi:imidazolonepropionase-like amidohydrolase